MNAGKVLYGVLFMLLLPFALFLWSRGAAQQIPLPVPGTAALGFLLTSAGALLVVGGIASIVRWGEGLPMNAYPPARLVTRGTYRLLHHPIYTGFSLLCFGAAMVSRSAAGFWLVSPAATLGCVALVLGYEREDLERRFGRTSYRPWLALPPDADRPALASERWAVYGLVFLPWIAVYESLAALSPVLQSVEAYLPLEMDWPVLEWTEPIYVSTYVFVALAPLVARCSTDLRRLAVDGLLATAAAAVLWVVVPLAATPRPLTPSGPAGHLLLIERAHDVATNAFPSFHVTAALLAARTFATRWPGRVALWFGLAGAIAVSCITTGMHALVDVAGGVVLYAAVSHRDSVWERLRRATETVANSWREWRAGPVRVINHAFYAGACGLIGVSGIGLLLGADSLPAAAAVSAIGVLGAALGAQLLEGSSGLLRPYGYFGAVAGVVGSAALGAWLFGGSAWRLIAAFCMCAPWIVGVGRLRCLVQGCCHGRRAPEDVGVRFTHPMSRVCRLAGLSGTPIHATQLYSILWNGLLGLLLARLWVAHASFSIVVGVYFLLAGLGRFVEEAYRGEPQTPIVAGLRAYQWLSVASVVGGAVATCVSTGPAGGWEPSGLALAAGLAFGLVAALAYGVDFPGSQARFARLT